MNTKKFKKTAAGLMGAIIAATSVPVLGAGMSAAAADDPNYYEALAMSLYFFDSNACGTGITDGPLTWRGDCHTYDANASVGSLDGSLKSIVDPDGDGKIDVSGGWHDAGDHIKFNLTIGFGASSLAMSEYLNEGIYEKAGCRDHLEYEMRWAADYLMKTTFLDGLGNVAAIAHVVANGDVDHGIWTAPEVQTYDRPVYWLTAGKNNSAVCGEMAAGLAGAAYIFKDSDPVYAEKCLEYSKALIEFGKKNRGNEGDGLSKFYPTDSMCEDEFALAEAWLWINGAGSKPSLTPDRGQYSGIYDYHVYSWDKVWQGYAALMYKATGDKAFADELEFELNNQGGLKEGTYNANGWGASRYNCAKQMNSYLLANGDPNSSFAKGAKYQMDFILGNNSRGYSYLLGFGDKWPTHIHHRAANPGGEGVTSAQNPEAKYTNYGMLVGGEDSSGNYEDHADRYQFTEGALDYNGCFVIACASAANLYGGDASTFKTIQTNASEINDSFDFGGGSVIVEPVEYYVTVSVVDKETGDLLSGAELSMERHKTYGEAAEWNTADENPKTIQVSDYAWEEQNPGEYTLTLKTLPEGYVSEKTSWTVKDFDWTEPVTNITIELTKAEEPEYTLVPDKTEVNTGETVTVGIKGWDRPTRDWNVSVDSENVKISSETPISFNVTIEKAGTYDITVSFPGGVTKTVQIKAVEGGSSDRVWGDANCNGEVRLNDAVLVMQALGNPDVYGENGSDATHISSKGIENADVYENGTGLTNQDALMIQKFLINLVDTLDPNKL